MPSIHVELLAPELRLRGCVRGRHRVGVAAPVERQAVHVADAEVEVAERRRVGVDAVPERPRPRLDGRAVGVVHRPVVVVVHREADRDAAAEAGELGLVQQPPEPVGEVVGRRGVTGVAGVVGIADVALVDERRGGGRSGLEQAVIPRVLGCAGELGAARREQHERPVGGVGLDPVRLGAGDGGARRSSAAPPASTGAGRARAAASRRGCRAARAGRRPSRSARSRSRDPGSTRSSPGPEARSTPARSRGRRRHPRRGRR